MRTILEYLKHRSKQNYIDFPEDLNDADAIVDWLDRNNIKRVFRMSDVLRAQHPCYIVGPMDTSNPNTCWIEIADGKTFAVAIRTTDDFVNTNTSKISYYERPDYMQKTIDVDELHQYLEKILNSK